jgi:hypothetical protein
MKKYIIKTVFALFIITSGLLTSCVNSDTYDVPQNNLKTYDLTPTKTVKQISLLNTTVAPLLITTDDIIEAYVTSSDEKSNFYKSISFQSLDPIPVGFSVPINITSSFAEGFVPGRKVYIKLKGLYVAQVYGSMQIGGLYNGAIGRIAEDDWKNRLFISATKLDESAFVRNLSLSDAITNDNQNTLIEIDAVQFAESSLNRTYYDVDSGGGATNHLMMSATTMTSVIRFSDFAPFSGNMVPSGSGKIRGVLSKYNSTFQFVVRYETDIKLFAARLDSAPPIGGAAITYPLTLNETFESFTASTTNPAVFPSYINDAYVGSKYWTVRTFSGNKYAEMSSFNSGGANTTFLVMPVTLTPGYKFSFKSKDGFNNGNVLKVYYSRNYVPGGNIAAATLVDITSSFTIASGTTSGYAVNFTNSNNFTIPAGITGNGFFIFEYKGEPTPTTTIQIDDVKLIP